MKGFLPFALIHKQADRFIDICHEVDFTIHTDCLPMKTLVCGDSLPSIEKTMQHGATCKYTAKATFTLRRWRTAIHEFYSACEYIEDRSNKKTARYLIDGFGLLKWKYLSRQELGTLIKCLKSTRLELLDNLMLRSNTPTNDADVLRTVFQSLQLAINQATQTEISQISW